MLTTANDAYRLQNSKGNFHFYHSHHGNVFLFDRLQGLQVKKNLGQHRHIAFTIRSDFFQVIFYVIYMIYLAAINRFLPHSLNTKEGSQ